MAISLENRVIGELSGSAQHQARVVANLCRILEREQRLGPSLDSDAASVLASLLGEQEDNAAVSTQDLWESLARRVNEVTLDEPSEAETAFLERAHSAVHRIVRDKLAVSKPGYDSDSSQEPGCRDSDP